MTEVFTGLLRETAEELAARRSEELRLPPMASTVPEPLFDSPPAWMPIENQQSTNMCAAHAGTSCVEKLNFLASGEFVQLCRNYVYRYGLESAGMSLRDAGCTLGGIIAALKRHGVPPENLWPFSGRAQFSVPAGCDAAAKTRRLMQTIDIEAGGYDSLRIVLGQNIGAGLIATRWPLRMVDGYRVERYQPLGNGGHALAALFLSSETDSRGRPKIWVANSHSEDAQWHGWQLWSADAYEESRNDNWGNTGLTDMTLPQPREVDWTGANNPFAK